MRELFKVEYLIATFFGAGYFPKIPGTFASAVAIIPLLLFPADFRFLIVLVLIVLLSFISLPLISIVESVKGSDSSIIVIDEVIGIWLTLCSPFIPLTWLNVLLGFILFRLFDILKPGIISYINHKEGAIYVILDDICAAIFSLALLHAINFVLKFVFFYKYFNFF